MGLAIKGMMDENTNMVMVSSVAGVCGALALGIVNLVYLIMVRAQRIGMALGSQRKGSYYSARMQLPIQLSI